MPPVVPGSSVARKLADLRLSGGLYLPRPRSIGSSCHRVWFVCSMQATTLCPLSRFRVRLAVLAELTVLAVVLVALVMAGERGFTRCCPRAVAAAAAAM